MSTASGSPSGTGATPASSPSGPAIRASAAARSSTDVASGPITVRPSSREPQRGKWPVSGTRPNVGFRPAAPHQAAGSRMLPPESLPRASGEAPAATSAAAPDDDPPGARSGSRGLRVRPWAAVSARAQLIARGTAPAARSRATAVASAAGRRPGSARGPVVAPSTRQPSTSIQSLTVNGTPSSRRAAPARSRRSDSAAAASVRSGSVAATAPMTGRSAPRRSR